MRTCLGVQGLPVCIQRQVVGGQRRDVGEVCEGHPGACHRQADAHDACSDAEHTPSQLDTPSKLEA